VARRFIENSFQRIVVGWGMDWRTVWVQRQERPHGNGNHEGTGMGVSRIL
jgi:hypothetical protein